ncbi:MAG TPA: hypothetical protein VMM12_16645 [Longimicrobiales bacterium]|nr:hypothetical protein [Longimicrobiales bacterium]
MGIRFIDSILTLLAASCVVFAAYFVGHALSSEHGGWAWITAAVLVAIGVALGLLTARRLRGFAASRDQRARAHDPARGHPL